LAAETTTQLPINKTNMKTLKDLFLAGLKAVWQRTKPLQNLDFAALIDSCLK
jgi:hypothetical protein